MRSTTSVLELTTAVAPYLAMRNPLSLRLQPGECALIEAADTGPLALFADLCSGLVEPMSGGVRFLGHDWTAVPDEYAAALRGRIGRVFTAGAWVPFLDVGANILLPALYHTGRSSDDLRGEALALAHELGLPGLPLDRPDALAPDDLDRAALVRAFLGEPLLVMVEDRATGSFSRSSAVLSRVAATCDRGGAVMWLARERTVADAESFPATLRFRLSERGLAPVS